MDTIKLELKITDYDLLFNKDYIKAAREEGFNTISFGSESCYKQLPGKDMLDTIFENIGDFRKKLVVPILFESHFDRVVQYVDTFIDRIDCLCVNDLGLLHYAHENYAHRLKTISIGPGLFYSYKECPWVNHIVRDEVDRVKENVYSSNFNSSWMVDFVKSFPFCFEFEVPASSWLIEKGSALREEGFVVNMGMGIIPVSYARACHTARYYKKEINRCDRVCRQKFRLTSTHRWDFFEGDVVQIRPVIQKQMPDFVIWGNAIYLNNTEADISECLKKVDSIVYDQRMVDSVQKIKDLPHKNLMASEV